MDHARSLRVGDPLDDDDRRRADGLGAAAREGRGPGRGRRGGRRRAASSAATAPGIERGHFYAPAVVTGAPARDRPAARGDLRAGGADRAGGLARRGHRAGQRARRFGLGANVYTRDLETAVRCLREIKRRHGLDQRPAHRQRRRPVRRDEAVRPRARARPGGPRGLPGDQARRTSRRRSRRRSGGTPTAAAARRTAPDGRSGRARGSAGGAGQRQREGGVLVELELAAAAQVDLEVGEHLDRPLQRAPVGLLGPRDRLLGEPGRPPSDARHLLLRHAGLDARPRRGAPRAAAARPGRPAGPRARRGTRAARRARGSRAGRRPRARRRGRRPGGRLSPAARLLDVRRARLRGGMERDRELLQLAREPLLAGPDQRDQLLGRLRIELQPELARRARPPTSGSSQGFGAGHSRTSPPAFSTAVAQRLQRLAADDAGPARCPAATRQRRLQRAELGGLPGAASSTRR